MILTCTWQEDLDLLEDDPYDRKFGLFFSRIGIYDV